MARSERTEGLSPMNWPGITPRKVEHPGGGEIKTKQDQRDSTDINMIVENFKATGRVGNVIAKPPMFGDFSAARSLTEALEVVQAATANFAELHPAIREAAGNSPVQFLDMMADEGGRALLEKAGAKIAAERQPAGGSPAGGAPAAPGTAPVAPDPAVS